MYRPGGGDKAYLSVEERVMAHYRSEYPSGLDDEGETLVSMVVLALWGAVYDKGVASAWGSACQDRPLDWGTPRFWSSRCVALEARLGRMMRTPVAALAAGMSETREARGGTLSLVRWELLAGLDLQVR